MMAYLLAIIYVVTAVIAYTVPAGSLPTFMPGYADGSTHIHHLHTSPRWSPPSCCLARLVFRPGCGVRYRRRAAALQPFVERARHDHR